ncbi:unnamed protein product [Didymodactylos carnosus]|uniref:Uncharacterized protein n=1 Tax=Didymodactylos carnosus TaxID=1234261 RepID=A0A815JYW9_9BILA|nr:unnamed protein product [Didymodactylos carnosus]CAF1386314.1 unnamed protein product [Didymodactylos carnosus]CAF3600357.1 unnamed protein product [Didymodactylos carnosus]CAF4281288.1 unnamed protein product [Didymodactylos carnosus]
MLFFALMVSLSVHSSNCTDQLFAWPDESTNKESQFEGIAYNPMHDTYFVVQEAIKSVDDKKKFNPNVFEIRFTTSDSIPVIQILESCPAHWDFDSDNKGFEGLEFIAHQHTKQSYLLGLCEANSCASKSARRRASNPTGNGTLIVLEKKEATSKKSCSWEPVGTISLPSSVQFNDYSSVSIYRRSSSTLPTYIAVTSQENSQVWIGLIEEINDPPYFRVSSLQKTTVYDLPRATQVPDQCSIQYCNIEGVAWRGINQLILVSDRSKTDQEAVCVDKDQSVHSFVLPEYLTD